MNTEPFETMDAEINREWEAYDGDSLTYENCHYCRNDECHTVAQHVKSAAQGAKARAEAERSNRRYLERCARLTYEHDRDF